jgi:hypothetical protein
LASVALPDAPWRFVWMDRAGTGRAAPACRFAGRRSAAAGENRKPEGAGGRWHARGPDGVVAPAPSPDCLERFHPGPSVPIVVASPRDHSRGAPRP